MKKLSLVNLEQLEQRQMLEVKGGYGDVNWCDCWLYENGCTDSISVWHATPDPRTGGGGGGNPGDNPNDSGPGLP